MFSSKKISTKRIHRYPFLDIFWVELKNNEYCLSEPLPKILWPYDCIDTDNLFPLTKIKLGELLVNSPRFPENYLEKIYGNDWKTVGYITHCHRPKLQLRNPIKLSIN